MIEHPRRRPFRRLLPFLALALAACMPPLYPGKSGDYDVAVGKAWAKSHGWSGWQEGAETLTLDQLYAIHRYGLNKIHPSPTMNAEFARRGAAAAPFLRSKLESATTYGQVGSIFEALLAMQEAGSYDVSTDSAFVAVIQSQAARWPDKYEYLRDKADELETRSRIPFGVAPWGRRPFQGLGDDYNVNFAKAHCRGCDYREWTAGLDALPIEQLYALHRYGWEGFALSRNIDHIVARRGASAIPFFKQKLAGPGGGSMVWTIASALEAMRKAKTYDASSDAELMSLLEAASARSGKHWRWAIDASIARLRSGEISPIQRERMPLMG
jgi:hypothetical protein